MVERKVFKMDGSEKDFGVSGGQVHARWGDVLLMTDREKRVDGGRRGEESKRRRMVQVTA